MTPASAGHLARDWSVACTCWSNRPLVAGNTVYVVDGYSGAAPYALSLHAFDAADGRSRWNTPLGLSGAATLAAVANGLVYLTVQPASGSDRLVAIDASTGSPRWRVTPSAPGSGRTRLDRPVVDGPLVFTTATASDASQIAAIDPTGRGVWSAVPGGQVWMGSNLAIVPGQTVYVASEIFLTSGEVVHLLRGYSVLDGRAGLTSVIPNGLPVLSLAAANGLVYGTWQTEFGRISSVGAFAVHPENGMIAWSGDLFALAVTPRVALTHNPRTGVLTARDALSGAVLWRADQHDFGAAVTDQLVVFDQGSIRRLSDGALVGRVQSSDGTPLEATTPSNGRVFAVSATDLYAFVPSTP